MKTLGLGLLLLSASPNVQAESQRGPSRKYQIRYQYRLKNKTAEALRDVRVHIPVPRNCMYQDIEAFAPIRPEEADLRTVADRFGQDFCRFTIGCIDPHATAEVGFLCDATLYPGTRVSLDRRRVGPLRRIPSPVRELYTSNLLYVYDLQDPGIQEKAKALVAPHENVLDQVFAIHDFVGRMKYDRDGRWDGAAVVLRRGNGSCSEFSYLFSGLCRSAGIPTRFAGGTSCRHKRGQSWPVKDTVYHRWAEVFLPPYGWVPLDVTRDRGDPPRRSHFGSGPRNVLILSRGGGGSRYLGNHYIGSNSQWSKIDRERVFFWSKR